MDEKDVAFIVKEVRNRLIMAELDCKKLREYVEIDAPVDFCFRLSCIIGTLELCKNILNHFGER